MMRQLFFSPAVRLALGVGAFILLLGWAGRYEMADEVVYSLSETVYEAIVEKLGEDCDNCAIAEEYLEHRDYYDQMDYLNN